ncbi:hypothetical protein AMTR_s00026p00235040 [Amborella trichopoda]|uniref:Aminotransferase-like plant mobile domain-containing protein n=1 Tax=Amborella trichopoda TaxID=13333 RepID=W1PT37_AMBTC|nr:hypothetical protein AMTR_s00026p00235040 [Amborella trichopoda]
MLVKSLVKFKFLVLENGFYVECRSHLFAIRKWAELLTPEQRQALARIGLWEVCRIRPFSLDCALISELFLRYRPKTDSNPLRCGELAPTLEDVTRIFGIPPKSSISYASYYNGLLGVPYKNIKGRRESEIRLGKLRLEFTRVLHCAEGMMGRHAPHILISTASRPSYKGKAPMEEDSESRCPRVSGSAQGESSYLPTRATVGALAESSVRS